MAKDKPKKAETTSSTSASAEPKASKASASTASASDTSKVDKLSTSATSESSKSSTSTSTTTDDKGSIKMSAGEATTILGEGKVNDDDKSKEVLVGYMRDLAIRVHAVHRTKISEINLYNIREVINQASQGVEDKQLINHATMAYSTISNMLFNLVQSHVRGIQDDLIHGRITYENIGSLEFKGAMLYLKNTAGGIKVMSSVNDPAYTYQFLLLRSVNGERAHTIEPTYRISFKPDADKYTGNEVLMKFNYIDQDGQEASSHISNKPNPKATSILNADKEEVRKIIQNVFERHKDECNILKDALPAHQMIVCTGFSKVSDSDGTIKFFTCLETFQLAHDTSLCGAASFIEDFVF